MQYYINRVLSGRVGEEETRGNNNSNNNNNNNNSPLASTVFTASHVPINDGSYTEYNQETGNIIIVSLVH